MPRRSRKPHIKPKSKSALTDKGRNLPSKPETVSKDMQGGNKPLVKRKASSPRQARANAARVEKFMGNADVVPNKKISGTTVKNTAKTAVKAAGPAVAAAVTAYELYEAHKGMEKIQDLSSRKAPDTSVKNTGTSEYLKKNAQKHFTVTKSADGTVTATKKPAPKPKASTAPKPKKAASPVASKPAKSEVSKVTKSMPKQDTISDTIPVKGGFGQSTNMVTRNYDAPKKKTGNRGYDSYAEIMDFANGGPVKHPASNPQANQPNIPIQSVAAKQYGRNFLPNSMGYKCGGVVKKK